LKEKRGVEARGVRREFSEGSRPSFNSADVGKWGRGVHCALR